MEERKQSGSQLKGSRLGEKVYIIFIMCSGQSRDGLFPAYVKPTFLYRAHVFRICDRFLLKLRQPIKLKCLIALQRAETVGLNSFCCSNESSMITVGGDASYL